jgi:hypothetical protein
MTGAQGETGQDEGVQESKMRNMAAQARSVSAARHTQRRCFVAAAGALDWGRVTLRRMPIPFVLLAPCARFCLRALNKVWRGILAVDDKKGGSDKIERQRERR